MGTQTAVSPKGSPNAAPPSNPILNFMPMIVVVGILYMLVIRPQQKQEKERKRMIDDLKTGDRVLTQGGIYGTVSSLRGQIVQLKIADNVKVDVSRSAISQIITEATNGSSPVVTAELV
jgi:preprotein translocase subunit YajC